jgi:hypothetical protein
MSVIKVIKFKKMNAIFRLHSPAPLSRGEYIGIHFFEFSNRNYIIDRHYLTGK